MIRRVESRHCTRMSRSRPPLLSSTPSGARWAHRALASLSVAAILLSSAPARAYFVRETASGLPVRWPDADITLEIDPSLTDAVPGALAAVTAAAIAWTDANLGPKLHVTFADSASTPAVDGRNVVYFIPGYPTAAGALAITLVSYDDVTGAIVDTDIVINGSYDFAVLPAADRPAAGAVAVANEPATSTPGPFAWAGSQETTTAPVDFAASAPFDLVHILTHETGHALGLDDAAEDTADVMYLYSSPGDASRRTPASDDLAGIEFLYGNMPATAQGCSVTGRDSGPSGAPLAAACALIAYVASRRRRVT